MASGTSRSNVQNVTTYGSSDRSHAGIFSSFLMPSLPSASLLLHSFQHIPDIRVLSAVEFKYRDTAHAELLRKRDFLRNRGGVRPSITGIKRPQYFVCVLILRVDGHLILVSVGRHADDEFAFLDVL